MVKARFAIVGAVTRETVVWLANRTKEVDAKRDQAKEVTRAADDPSNGLSDVQRVGLREQAAALTNEASGIETRWGAGGTHRQVLNALSSAAGGNVAGGGAQFAQKMLVSYVQQQGAAYIGKLVTEGTLSEGSAPHAALHAMVACAGAMASSESCSAGAMGAASSALLTHLFNDAKESTAEEKQAKSNLIASMVAGVAQVAGVDAATALHAAQSATDNNYLTQQQQTDRAVKMAECTTPDCRKEVQAEYAQKWVENEAAIKGCSSTQACTEVISDLRTQQAQYTQREDVLQAKLATGAISAAEISELASLKSAGANLISLRTIALGNLVRVSGKSEATSQEVGRLVAELGVGAVPGVGGAAVVGATRGRGAVREDMSDKTPVIGKGFVPAARTGLTFETKSFSGLDGHVKIELSARQKFDKNGAVVPSKFAQSDLVAKFSPNGTLRVDWYGTSVVGHGVGREMISRAIEAVGSQNVKVVSAKLGNTNLDAFRAATASGMSREQAVLNTPLGKSMNALGFKKVGTVSSSGEVIFHLDK